MGVLWKRRLYEWPWCAQQCYGSRVSLFQVLPAGRAISCMAALMVVLLLWSLAQHCSNIMMTM